MIDLETGGEKCGILQILVKFLLFSSDKIGDPFNKYIKPSAGPVFYLGAVGISETYRMMKGSIEQILLMLFGQISVFFL